MFLPGDRDGAESQVGGIRLRTRHPRTVGSRLGLPTLYGLLKNAVPLCQALIPPWRDCDLTPNCVLDKCVRSHKSVRTDSQDLTQPCLGTLSTGPFMMGIKAQKSILAPAVTLLSPRKMGLYIAQ